MRRDMMTAGSRRGLTLIELLVVIVILTTLVGGVLPVLSPNNDARKIREAARGLQTYIMQAQAQAARTGRPAGIAFRESAPGSGVALEVFQIEVPPPYPGLSEYSVARIRQRQDRSGLPLEIQFVLSNSLDPDVPVGEERVDLSEFTQGELFRPKMIKYGDIVVVGGKRYRLIDQRYNEDDLYYFDEPPEGEQVLLQCEPVDELQTLPLVEPPYREVPLGNAPLYGITAVKPYKILRQPKVTGSASVPYQLPAGVAIDLQASGTEGGATPTQFCRGPDYLTGGTTALKQVGILFSPRGGVQEIFYQGYAFGPGFYTINTANQQQAKIENISDAAKIYLLLGRAENGGVDIENRKDASRTAWELSPSDTKEVTAEKQARINWLNLDSRWVALDARSGRISVAENTYVDGKILQSRVPGGTSQNDKAQAFMQAQIGRDFVRSGQSGGDR